MRSASGENQHGHLSSQTAFYTPVRKRLNLGCFQPEKSSERGIEAEIDAGENAVAILAILPWPAPLLFHSRGGCCHINWWGNCHGWSSWLARVFSPSCHTEAMWSFITVHCISIVCFFFTIHALSSKRLEGNLGEHVDEEWAMAMAMACGVTVGFRLPE